MKCHLGLRMDTGLRLFCQFIWKRYSLLLRYPHLCVPAGVLEKYNTVRQWLKAASIRIELCSYWFLQKADVLFLRKMVWLIADFAGTTELGTKSDGVKQWKAAEIQVSSLLLMELIMDGRVDLFQGGYTLLCEFASPIFLVNRLGNLLVWQRDLLRSRRVCCASLCPVLFVLRQFGTREECRLFETQYLNALFPTLMRRTRTRAWQEIRRLGSSW